jgi:2-polyprenyl-3-methyl-5-hydroxy-6-metoxy-1,4-benzoquinol methylase
LDLRSSAVASAGREEVIVPYWNPSARYRKVADANRAFYARTARWYDGTEPCVVSARLQQALEADLDRIVGGPLAKAPHTARALDACGGSGNVASKLLRRGVRVTVCDVSPDLLEIFRLKHAGDDGSVEIVCAEIGEYLARSDAHFDLIVFSSALHHLEDIRGVLTLAFERLNPGGLLFTVFDPTSRQHTLARALTRLDYVAFKIHKQPADVPASILRHVRRTWRGRRRDDTAGEELSITDDNVGVLAEYHVDRGIDDLDLVRWLRQIGFEVVWHQRYSDARYAATRVLLRWLDEVTMFKLLLRKPTGGACP